jgi:hypothetical protein
MHNQIDPAGGTTAEIAGLLPFIRKKAAGFYGLRYRKQGLLAALRFETGANLFPEYRLAVRVRNIRESLLCVANTIKEA